MTILRAKIGCDCDEMAVDLASFQVDLLRRTHRMMADAIDRDAQRDIESARDWRDLTAKRVLR